MFGYHINLVKKITFECFVLSIHMNPYIPNFRSTQDLFFI